MPDYTDGLLAIGVPFCCVEPRSRSFDYFAVVHANLDNESSYKNFIKASHGAISVLLTAIVFTISL